MIRYPIKYKSVNKDHHPKKCRFLSSTYKCNFLGADNKQ